MHRIFLLTIALIVLFTPSATAGKFTEAVASAAGLEGRVLWVDLDANILALDSREKVIDLVKNCSDANINTIVLDVKSLAGQVNYHSNIAPRIKEWRGQAYPQDFDVLRVMAEEARKAKIGIHANVNVLSEGSAFDKIGPALSHPEWQTIIYSSESRVNSPGVNSYKVDGVNSTPQIGKLYLITEQKHMQIPEGGISVSVDQAGLLSQISPAQVPANGFVLIGSGPAGDWLKNLACVGTKISLESKPKFIRSQEATDEHGAVFINPINPEARDYEFSIIKEIVQNYDVDGIVFDRLRYTGIYSDFSELSRNEFEKWLGQKVERFPEDILAIDPMPGRDYIKGKYFGKWMEWRAKNIRDFLADARKVIKSIKPKVLVGVYAGSWYDSYYDVGVNWASPSHKPPYPWAAESYRNTGFADLADWMCTGCYYPFNTREEAKLGGWGEGASIEAAGTTSNNVVEDDTFVYAGIYLLHYIDKPDMLKRAIEKCNETTQGVMLFDLCYIRDNNWWDILKRAFSTPTKAPHDVTGLIEKVREIRTITDTAQ